MLKTHLCSLGKNDSQIAIFSHLMIDKVPFIHVVTHLKAKPGFEQRRKDQGVLLLDGLKQFVGDNNLPVVVGGDFNDVPESLVYNEFVNAGLSSAYAKYDDSKMEPFTTLKKRKSLVKHCIDYLWYSKEISVNGLLEIPLESDLPDLLPCRAYPSDHLAILADFIFN